MIDLSRANMQSSVRKRVLCCAVLCDEAAKSAGEKLCEAGTRVAAPPSCCTPEFTVPRAPRAKRLFTLGRSHLSHTDARFQAQP